MEIIFLSSSAATTTHFVHPTLKTRQWHRHCVLSLPRLRATAYPPSKTANLPRLDYKNQLIPKPISETIASMSSPERERNPCINTGKNTSSDVLRLMDGLGVPVTPDIYASLIDECTQKKDDVQAAELYAHMKRSSGTVNFLNSASGLLLLNRILLMLVVCGCFDVAHHVFEKMRQGNSISLAIMMAGLINNQLFDKAVDLFVRTHQCVGYRQSDTALQVVVVCVLKACVNLKNIYLGKQVHGWLLKMGYGRELSLGTALIEFYGKLRCLREANSVFFDQIPTADQCDTVFWTCAIVNNCREGCFKEAFRIFQEMGRAAVRKSEYTFSSVLKACGGVSDDGYCGRQVHGNSIKLGLDSHVFVMCGLIDMYGRCGLLKDAIKVFDMIGCDRRNSVCWNAMVNSYLQNGLHIEAIKTLYQTKAAGVKPSESLIDKVRLACGSGMIRMSTSKGNLYEEKLSIGAAVAYDQLYMKGCQKASCYKQIILE